MLTFQSLPSLSTIDYKFSSLTIGLTLITPLKVYLSVRAKSAAASKIQIAIDNNLTVLVRILIQIVSLSQWSAIIDFDFKRFESLNDSWIHLATRIVMKFVRSH